MRFIRSIKYQAVVVFALFSVLVTLLYFAIAATVAFIVEDKIIDKIIALEASYISEQFQRNGAPVVSRFDFIEIMELSGLQQLAGLDSNVPSKNIPSKRGEIFTTADDHYHYLLLDLPHSRPLYLVAEISPLLVVTNTPEFLQIFLGGLFISLLVASLLAFKMASFTVGPVMKIISAIKAGNKMPDLQHEVGFLAETLQHALDNLALALQREREFTTDVNHELRTPLTILNNIITLIETRGLEPRDLLQLREVSEHMKNSIEILLALARADALNKDVFLVRSVIEQVLLDCSTAHHMNCDVLFRSEENVTVFANLPLFRLLLINLVNNAMLHAKERALSITVSKNAILIVNASTDEVQEGIAKKGVKGMHSEGIGQGLYLVTRIAEAMGFHIIIAHHNAQFSVQISL